MPTLQEQRAEVVQAAEKIVADAKSNDRALTNEERETLKNNLAKIGELDEKISDDNVLQRVTALGQGPTEDTTDAASLGEHFIKHAGKRLQEMRGVKGASVAAPEYLPSVKAPVATGGQTGVYGPILTEIDRTLVRGYREAPVVADLLGSGTLSGQAITYYVEGAVLTQPGMVAEGGAKPEVTFAAPTTVTETLRKLAGWLKFTDEMMEDLSFVVSEINERLLYLLSKTEEAQLLNGDGVGQNLTGVLNRTGVQAEASASTDDDADAIFRAMTEVQTTTGLAPDGLVIHPADYQNLRLARDANGQYYAGGPFQGAYGAGTMQDNPPIWGLRTIVTTAIAQKTALVGAFRQGGTVYRKGGVRVESTNSHESDFTSNLVTVRAEQRIGLAVRVPAAFNAVTLFTPI